MAQKITLILLWSICTVGMNLGAKKLAMIFSVEKGILHGILLALKNPWFYLFFFTAIGTAVFYLWLLKLMPLSIAGAIVSSLGIVLVVITGAVFYQENVLDPRTMIGLLLALAGVITLQSAGVQ
ncbi:MAG: hypothetical protein RDV48_10810 [Candidatus Eremiobacteraeota bacterium]|nr:hypothetical protein [Candidatus Eremiobacteraeota bacterium]